MEVMLRLPTKMELYIKFHECSIRWGRHHDCNSGLPGKLRTEIPANWHATLILNDKSLSHLSKANGFITFAFTSILIKVYKGGKESNPSAAVQKGNLTSSSLDVVTTGEAPMLQGPISIWRILGISQMQLLAWRNSVFQSQKIS